MPYCRNCGAKLDDDARFCRVCGTPVNPVSTPYVNRAAPQQPRSTTFRTGGFPKALIAVIVIFLLGVAAIIVAFVPVQPVNFNQANQASAGNVDALRLTVNADIANVIVMLQDLPGNERVATQVSATGSRGIFETDNPVALAFSEHTINSTLEYSMNVSRAGGWSILSNLDVTCYLYIDPAVSLDVSVSTGTGSITMDAGKEATFTNLMLQTTTGSVSATLRETVVISGDLTIETTTGSSQLIWNNAQININLPVNVRATTGSVDVNVTQTKKLAGNVTLNAETTTGSVALSISLQSDVGARIAASTTLGGVNVNQSGFSASTAPLQSDNYPAGSNFGVTLRATTGSVNINANYELGGTRS